MAKRTKGEIPPRQSLDCGTWSSPRPPDSYLTNIPERYLTNCQDPSLAGQRIDPDWTSMSAKALRPVCDRREQAAPWQPCNSASRGSDRHDFAVSQGLDIANWGPAKESPVLAIELARAFVADLERRSRRIQFTREHALPRGMQAKLLLKLQRTHRRKGAKMEVQRRPTHACNRCQVLYTQRLLVV